MEQIKISADRRFIEGLSGMTCAVPAYAILELLNEPKLQAFQKLAEEEAYTFFPGPKGE